MNNTRDITCEIPTSDSMIISCSLPDMSFIEIAAGLGSALGTLVAAGAAVFGVYEAFKQRDRADKLEKKSTLLVAADGFFQAMRGLTTITNDNRFDIGSNVYRTLFDLSNLLKDGDPYQNRLAEALSVAISPIVDNVLLYMEPRGGESEPDAILRMMHLRSAKGLAETVAAQAQSAFNVVLNVRSDETKEERVAFFELRATSLAKQLAEKRKKEKGQQ